MGDVKTVGFIGPGYQGRPMLEAIVEASFDTYLWCRRDETYEPFRGSALTRVATKRELGERCDLVGVCVVTAADVEQVLFGDDGVLAAMRSGSIVAIHSTVAPDDCRRWAALAAEQEVLLIDAPVSGGPQGAKARQLLVMVGGDQKAFDRALPVFSTYGGTIELVGPVGSGQLTKLVNNLLFAMSLGIGSQAVQLAAAFGVDPAAVTRILGKGSGRSYAIELLTMTGGSPYPLRDPAGPLLRKDVDLVAAEAARVGFDLAALKALADGLIAEMGIGADGEAIEIEVDD